MSNSDETLTDGVYLCYGAKSCFNCLDKLSYVFETIYTYTEKKPHLILETKLDKQNAQRFINEIETMTKVKFNSYYINKIQSTSILNAECSFLCRKSIVYTPSILIIRNNQEYILSYNNMFDSNGNYLKTEEINEIISSVFLP